MPTRLNIYGQAISTTKKRPCIVATTTNIVLSGASTPTSIDGVNIGVDDRILVWQQNSPQDNGIYRLETSQLLSRDYDFNISDDLYAGIEVLVLSGLTYSGKTFYLTTTGDLTIGSSSLTFDILAGQNGTSGSSGGTGSSGASGSSGSSGSSGTEGTSGSSGTSGTEGTSGTSGTSGTEGTSGSSGSSGTSGTEGTSGSSGSSGTSGTEGTSGSSGTSGTEGTSGSSGSSGTSGTEGTSGSSGSSGTSGTSGSSGSSGTSGGTGSSGASGSSGTSGTSGLGSSGTSAFIVSSATTPLPINVDSSCYWFDTTNNMPMVSYYGFGVGSWSVGGALSIARYALAGAGSQGAGLAFGGRTANANVTCTEEYNGTSWSAGGALITARYLLAGAGTQNAGLVVGGLNSGFAIVGCTEEYDGTSWSVGGALIMARGYFTGAGTQNAGLVVGGLNSGFTIVGCTEEYDGTSWSAGGALITARCGLSGAGTQNLGLVAGGSNGANLSCTEEYNGTSWSAGGALATARCYLAGAGTQNEGLAAGGFNAGSLSCTEEYNGTSWSVSNPLITARCGLSGAGTQNAGLAFGGYSSGVRFTCTEEYSKIILVNSTGVGVSYGTINYVPKYTGTTAIGISQIFDNGTSVGIGTTSPTSKLHIVGASRFNGEVLANNLGFNTVVPTFGQSRIELSELSDVLWKANRRFTVTGISGYIEGLFSGGFGDAYSLTLNTITTININVAGQSGVPAIGYTYPQGKIYVSFYNVSYNYNSISLRTKKNGVWIPSAAPTDISTSTSFRVLKFIIGAANYLTDIELTIDVGGTNVQISAINYIPDRFVSEMELPYLSKHNSGNQTIFGNLGIGTTSPSTALQVNGTITTTSLVETSSIKIKENVNTLDNPLDIIKRLRGVEYNRIGETYNEIGVIAEEVNDVLPQVVNKDEEGNPTSVSYGRLTALLIEVVKKQDEQIENLIKRIEQLEK